MAVGYTAPDLEKTRMATQAPTPQESKVGWRHDPAYEHAVNSINQGLAKIGSAKTTNEQRLGEDYETSKRKAGQQNETNLSALQNKLANQGINYSGINLSEQGRLGKNFQDTIASLTQNKQRGMEDIATEHAEKKAQFEEARSLAEINRAERQETYEKEQAAIAAQAQASKDMADQQRQWMADLSARLTTLAQPQTTPTGQMALPKASPQAMVQQAVKQIPPPVPMPNLSQARAAQDMLRAQGFDPGATDGAIGPKTLAAYNNWRRLNMMPPVNKFTMEDWKLLSTTVPPNPQVVGSEGGAFRRTGGQQAY